MRSDLIRIAGIYGMLFIISFPVLWILYLFVFTMALGGDEGSGNFTGLFVMLVFLELSMIVIAFGLAKLITHGKKMILLLVSIVGVFFFQVLLVALLVGYLNHLLKSYNKKWLTILYGVMAFVPPIVLALLMYDTGNEGYFMSFLGM